MEVTFRISALLGLFVFWPGVYASLQCRQSTPCYCILQNNSAINLLPISKNGGGFRVEIPGNINSSFGSFLFLYDPCQAFKDIPTCQDATACLRDNVPGQLASAITLIKHGVGKWMGDVNNLYLDYSDTIDKEVRTLQVNLICNDKLDIGESKLEITNASAPENTTALHIEADLTSKCACLNGCPMAPEPAEKVSSGLSAGSVLLIVFLVMVVVYLLGGIIYNKVVNGAVGKELIPNVTFWTEFPKLVLDGAAFTCNCCRSRQTNTGYDNM